MATSLNRFCGVSTLLCCLYTLPSLGQQEAQDPPVPTIPDEPKVIDPATLLPDQLATSVTKDFSDSSLRELTSWLQDEHDFVVLLDTNALAEIGVSPAEPISDRLDNGPIYLLLNRLRSLGLAWHFRNDVLHITSREQAESQQTTIPHHVGDLLDAGYERDTLVTVILNTVAPESWDQLGGAGVLSHLGDVLLIRQTDALQREVTGLLAALRGHGRQTFVNTPPQHSDLRDRLGAAISVDFVDTPLEEAVRRIGRLAEVDARLDLPALREIRVREREPVTLRLSGRKLEIVLRALLLDLDLTWDFRDGVMWITSSEAAESHFAVVVYDVRDLCRDSAESNALIQAITSQTEPDSWDTIGGPGSIEAAKPGTLVINQQERIHTEVFELLETYRTALRSSKPRRVEGAEPDEWLTVFYRLDANVAQDLSAKLPLLVKPGSWKSIENPEAMGTVLRVNSPPEIRTTPVKTRGASPMDPFLSSRAVLVIHQKRATHEEIREVLRRISTGDTSPAGNAKGMGGMGGFGGGFFSVPVKAE